MIENRCNTNEILIIETVNRIFTYKKKENIIVQNNVELRPLQAHDKKITRSFSIRKMKAFNSTNHQDHVVVVIHTSYPDNRLWYAIFDCKSYQWVDFTKNTNAKNTFAWAKRPRVNWDKHLHEWEFGCEWLGSMIHVRNYLLIIYEKTDYRRGGTLLFIYGHLGHK